MKYNEIDWEELQKIYDVEKISEKKLCEIFNTNESRLHRAKKKGLFRSRDKSELRKIRSEKGKSRVTSDETKLKISLSRKKYLLENTDKVPYLLNHSSKESYPEKYFTELFDRENIIVEKKYRIGLYELDFCISDKKIDIEIDGNQHYNDEKIVQSDIRRNEFLIKNGWDIIRINWSHYQKSTFEEKNKYIIELKKYLNNLIDEKPTLKIIQTPSGKDICGCGKFKYKKSKKCLDCYHTNSRKIQRPTLGCLLEEIKELGYRGTGKKHNVSDNAIRKWVKYLQNKT